MICKKCKNKLTCIDTFETREKRHRVYKCKTCKTQVYTIENYVTEQSDIDVFMRLQSLERKRKRLLKQASDISESIKRMKGE